MSNRQRREFTEAELKLLAELWETSVTDKRLCELFGTTRKHIVWTALHRLKLPRRRIARERATERYLERVGGVLQ